MVDEVLSLLTLSMEVQCLYNEGGIIDQPPWFIELLSYFAPIYDKLKFISKAKMVLGDSSTSTPKKGPARQASRRR